MPIFNRGGSGLGKGESTENVFQVLLHGVKPCVFGLTNRVVLLLRSLTIFCITLARMLLPQNHHDKVFSLCEKADGLYGQLLCNKSNISEQSLTTLKDAEKNLRKVTNGKALAGHAKLMYAYIKDLKGKDWKPESQAMSQAMNVLSHAPAIGLAFAALVPVLQAFENDTETEKLIELTAENIEKLVKDLKKIPKTAAELEKNNTWFNMIEDGCNKLRLVIEDRSTSVWKRFRLNRVHRASLDSWNATVENMYMTENRDNLNIIVYRIQFIREVAKTQFAVVILIVVLSIITLVLLWNIRMIVLEILHRLDPFHVKIARSLQNLHNGFVANIRRVKMDPHN